MQSYDRFTLMVPCAAITRPNALPDSYSLALDITREKWQLFLLKTDPEQPVRFQPDMSEYTEFRVEKSEACVFTGPNIAPFALFFLSGRANLRRLVYTLADAGLLIPMHVRDSQFRLLPRPSFLPVGDFEGHGPTSFLLRVIEFLKVRSVSVTPENRPFFPGLVRVLASYFIDRLSRATSRLFAAEGRGLVNTDLNRRILLEWLREVAPPKGDFRRDGADAARPQPVDGDCLRHPPHKLCGPEELKTTCADIIRVAQRQGRQYLQGNLHIVQRIVVLIAGESGLQEDKSGDPNWLAAVDRSDFAFSAYMFLTEFFQCTSGKVLSTILARIGPVILELLEKGIPGFIPFLHQYLDNLFFVSNDLPHMFAASIKEVWRIWYWIFRQTDHLKAYAAVTLGFIIWFTRDHCDKAQREPESMTEAWPHLVEHIDSAEALTFAVFLLKKLDTESSHLSKATDL
jgi:hypothetical protein